MTHDTSSAAHCEPFDAADDHAIAVLRHLRRPAWAWRQEGAWRWRQATEEEEQSPERAIWLPPLPLDALGDSGFRRAMGIRYAYVGGSMAKGISSVALVRALGEAGMLGFFGSAGLALADVERAIDELQRIQGLSFGCNLIHSPTEPELEDALVDLYLRRKVDLIEASAFLDMRLSLVRYRTHGIHRDATGRIVTPNRIVGKVSREEVACKFFAPPPPEMLAQLVQSGVLQAEQAELARQVPMADAVTAEADSGGHTDNRPALALFPTLQAWKSRLQAEHGYTQPLHLGLGGGIGTPAAAAAAFAMGADYIVVGSVHQACVESGSSDVVRQMLAETRQADVTMAPSGDMFEMGVTVQVIKRGTMFPMRAARLYQLYRQYDAWDDIPEQERRKLEQSVFRQPVEEIWRSVEAYFATRDPRQIERARVDAKHRMALIFRWYLGLSPVWANQGEPTRRMDYQIWCGPAMGAFNEWTQGSFLARPEQRGAACVAMNLLYGAALHLRWQQCRMQGIPLPAARISPLPYAKIMECIS